MLDIIYCLKLEKTVKILVVCAGTVYLYIIDLIEKGY